MRIGIDAHILGKNKGGVERYVERLVHLLPQAAPEHEYIVFVNREYYNQDLSHDRTHYVALPCSDPILERSVVLPWLARRHGLDFIHTQRIAPALCGCRSVVNIHDLLPLAEPRNHRGFRNVLIRLLTPGTIRRATRIVTVSQTVRREIIQRFGVAESQVVAIYNGVDRNLFHPAAPNGEGLDMPGRLGLQGPYLLYLGAIEPRKSLDTVLRAFKTFREQGHREVQLVLVGGVRSPRYRQQLTDLALSLDLGKDVVYTGFLDDAGCVALLRRARLFLAPSGGEGFDLPPLEAMACGTPVVCSDIEVHRELFTGSAAFFEVNDAEDLARTLLECWDDEQRLLQMREAGPALASKFTWENTACRMASLYRDLERQSDR